VALCHGFKEVILKKSFTFPWLLIGAVSLAASGAAMAQTKTFDLGKREYDANCALCHGSSGKADGPFVKMLRQPPSDLTTLTQRNGGVFPADRLYQTIEGAQVPSHGTREMPIWGLVYQIRTGDYYMGSETYDPDAFVRGRILSLVEYISRWQKP
jgi:mono/diheme cytochrome c family protein